MARIFLDLFSRQNTFHKFTLFIKDAAALMIVHQEASVTQRRKER